MTARTIAVLAACTMLASGSNALAARIPAECSGASDLLDRLYAYFGGVSSFAVAPVAEPVFSGGSMSLVINFQPSVFARAGVAIGTLGIGAPLLAVAPDADTFSLTIKGPESGALAFYVLVREDDNADDVIDLADGDDEWLSPEFFIPAGTITTFNIPGAMFVDSGGGSGNGVQNFTDTNQMGLVIDIHSDDSYPGGLITSSRTLYLDHIGFYAGAQAPPPQCPGPGDANADGFVGFSDITVVLTNFGMGAGPGDANMDGMVNFTDISTVLTFFGATCP